MCILLFHVLSSIKEKNRLIRKAMCVDVKHLLLRKTDALKTSIFSKRKIKECTRFEEQKGTRYIRANVYFAIIVFGCFSSTNPCLRFLLICLAWR